MNAPVTFLLVENSGKETCAVLKGIYKYNFPENSILTAVSKLFESNKLLAIELTKTLAIFLMTTSCGI